MTPLAPDAPTPTAPGRGTAWSLAEGVPRPPASARARHTPLFVAAAAFLMGFAGQMVALSRHPARHALPEGAEILHELRTWNGAYRLEATMTRAEYETWVGELGLRPVAHPARRLPAVAEHVGVRERPEAERWGRGCCHAEARWRAPSLGALEVDCHD